jgi:hypothetical protein
MPLGMAMLPKDSRQRWESYRGALSMATYARREKGRNYGTRPARAHENGCPCGGHEVPWGSHHGFRRPSSPDGVQDGSLGPQRPGTDDGLLRSATAPPAGVARTGRPHRAQRQDTRRVRLSSRHGVDDVDAAGTAGGGAATHPGTARHGGTPAPRRTCQSRTQPLASGSSTRPCAVHT